MSSQRPAGVRRPTDMSAGENNSLDVDWLLHSKKDHAQPAGHTPLRPEPDQKPSAPPAQNELTPPQSPVEPSAPNSSATNASHHDDVAPDARAPHPVNGASSSPRPTTPQAVSTTPTSASPAQPTSASARPHPAVRSPSHDESKGSSKGQVGSLKKDSGRRSSWISSLSSKFSSHATSTPSRNSSIDSQASSTSAPPLASPKLEFNNPFHKQQPVKDEGKKGKTEEKPVVAPSHQPGRRPSVLVPAGKETKLDSPGFLSSALRRLSSSNNTHLGKAAGSGAVGMRKVLNVNPNRERIHLQDFDQNKLKRVAFCVDVEIAGYAAQGDEEVEAPPQRPPLSGQQRSSFSAPPPATKKDPKDAKYKDMGEGAALKNPSNATIEKEESGQTKADTAAQKEEADAPSSNEQARSDQNKADTQPVPTSRKKEKKKRSEAERKERRERKRKHAVANGLVPLELTRDDDSSDSNSSHSSPGTSTPKKAGEQPTTDPLRIYKRCCQLRETTVLSRIKEQISKPSATLAEAPGTVAVLDLAGLEMQLADVATLGDWLAVVPVRKLVLDDCNLSDEALRVILSAIAGCKTMEQAKQNRKLPKRNSGKRGQEQMGVIEKLSLKNNTNITNLGWRHIALFLHASRSLRGIDLAGIPFPKSSGDLSRTSTLSNQSGSTITPQSSKSTDPGLIVIKAISNRLGDKLEELILSSCGLASSHVGDVVDCAIKCNIRRLGLADNNLDPDSLAHVVRYVRSGFCEGLDLGGNDLHETGHLVSNAIDESNPLFAVSFANCNLTPEDLTAILTPLLNLPNLKFVDLSQNHDLFRGSNNAVPIFRKLLPKFTSLKRLHLADVGMTPDHLIALSEVLPDCESLCHVSILENAPLVHAMNSKEGASQEEACAFFASLMTSVRISQKIIAIEIEVPSVESSEVVKALASQVVAYSLRNMERSALDDLGVQPGNLPDKDTPEVLLHLVGHVQGYSDIHDNDEPAPDEDYVIASTGIVKALGVCLGTGDGSSRSQSRNISPARSGTATPRQNMLRTKSNRKPRDVSLELCESARKIRMRLRPALIKEDRAGNDMNYRRLFFLDQTLQRMIQRFEDEYPETKIQQEPEAASPENGGIRSAASSLADASILSASQSSNTLSKVLSSEESLSKAETDSVRLSRAPSNTSLAAKAYTEEEGRMHRFGQSMRREVLKPFGVTDYAHGTRADDGPEPEHLAALRAKLEEYKGEDIRTKVETEGVDNVVKQLGITAQELALLQKEDPKGFEAFRNSQLAMEINGQSMNNGAQV